VNNEKRGAPKISRGVKIHLMIGGKEGNHSQDKGRRVYRGREGGERTKSAKTH